MDYIVLSFLLATANISLPWVVAGDNLNFPLIGPLLQRAGAVFIRRSFHTDQLYTAVFSSYVHYLLQQGVVLECFLEGGRSRTGKTLRPRTGFLQVISQAIQSGMVDDVTLVPISIAYDRVVEGDALVDEVLGAPKTKETLQAFVNAFRRVVRYHFGSIQIRISDRAVSWRQFVTSSMSFEGLFAQNFGSDLFVVNVQTNMVQTHH